MSYMALKHLHLAAIGCTLVFFVLRSGGLVLSQQWVRHVGVKMIHHATDLILLASALGLAAHLHQWPFYNSPWMTAKVLALLAYMLFTVLAVRRQQVIWLLPALASIVYAGWVAVNKVPF